MIERHQFVLHHHLTGDGRLGPGRLRTGEFLHHLQLWGEGGETVASNLLCLCPAHHRGLHVGDLSIAGDPEVGTVRFFDRVGTPIEPPGIGAAQLPDSPQPTDLNYVPPCGETLDARDFTWN